MPPEAPPVGRVVATELKPSTPHQFFFWTAHESPIGIGAIVRVEENGRIVFGVVTDGFAYSDLVSPLHAVIGADGDPVAAGAEPTVRAEIRLYSAAVLRQIPEEPLQPVPLGSVWLASDADVVLALRMDAYTGTERGTGIPVGLYAAGGLESPVYLDCDFLLGPEAAHLNITGVSGLATKTSAVEFVLGSIFQTFPTHKGTVAAVCFNVKGPDLCFLDQPAQRHVEVVEMVMEHARLAGRHPDPDGLGTERREHRAEHAAVLQRTERRDVQLRDAPGQRVDAVARADPERSQDVGEAGGQLRKARIGVVRGLAALAEPSQRGAPAARVTSAPRRSRTRVVGVRRMPSRRTRSRWCSASTSTCSTPGTAAAMSVSVRRVARHGAQKAVENWSRVARSPSFRSKPVVATRSTSEGSTTASAPLTRWVPENRPSTMAR